MSALIAIPRALRFATFIILAISPAAMMPQTSGPQSALAEGSGILNRTPHWYASPEWWLLSVGILTCFVIGWQSVETRRAANAAQVSAEAARLNARAIINAERPWMLLDIERGTPKTFSFRFTNYGRTPAEIVGFSFVLDYEKSTDDLPSPPEYRDEGTVMASTRIVAPGKLFTSPGEPWIFVPGSFSPEVWSEIERSHLRALCWGRLVT
jgi:hypothetical protein